MFRITGLLLLFLCVGCMKFIGPPPEEDQVVRSSSVPPTPVADVLDDEEELRKKLIVLRKQDQAEQRERIEQNAPVEQTATAEAITPVAYNGQAESAENLVPVADSASAVSGSEPAAEEAKPVLLREQLWIRVPFKTGFTSVDQKLVKPLTDIAGKYLAEPRKQTLVIRGFCDAEPIGGYETKKHKSRHGFNTQLALSQSRAKAVADILIKAGIKSNVIRVEGYGDTHFIADNKTQEGRDRNRRVDVFLIGE
ncbi:OmpA family protein [Mariprofundus sp. EBB-1]|uniref:OmpA family protein n=1 Tax=Mariprofundus sp. EBB-1 TaxID=2650971 RepID=UPI000EF24ADA|nr:OmpA family protein [Mariprofundus sp. EBB-1]RLL50028.1 OmpA family protein [Mariprofundus sp. EBB-1]